MVKEIKTLQITTTKTIKQRELIKKIKITVIENGNQNKIKIKQ